MLAQGSGKLELRVRARERLEVSVSFPTLGVPPNSACRITTTADAGQTTAVRFDLSRLPWTAVTLRGVPERHHARIDARFGPPHAGSGISAAHATIPAALHADRTAWVVLVHEGFIKGRIELIDGSLDLRDIGTKTSSWKVPLPPLLEVEPAEPVVSVTIVKADGETFRGLATTPDAPYPFDIAEGVPILFRSSTLRRREAELRLNASRAVSLSDCVVEWQGSDYALLRLPAAATRPPLELVWTEPAPLLTKARLIPVPVAEPSRAIPLDAAGVEATSVSPDGAVFPGVDAGTYGLRIEARRGEFVLRLLAPERIVVPDGATGKLEVRLERWRPAALVVTNWSDLPESARPGFVAIGRGNPTAPLDQDGRARVLIPDRPSVPVVLGPHRVGGGHEVAGRVIGGADGEVVVEAVAPSTPLRSVSVTVPKVFSGHHMAISSLPKQLPDPVVPLPPAGRLLTAKDCVVSWTPSEQDPRVITVWELSTVGTGPRMSFRALVTEEPSGPEFALGPDGFDATLVVPAGWSSLHAEIVATISGIPSPRGFATDVAALDAEWRLWIPSRCRSIRLHATDSQGNPIHREIHAPFSASLTLR